jgi:hypothetical protein
MAWTKWFSGAGIKNALHFLYRRLILYWVREQEMISAVAECKKIGVNVSPLYFGNGCWP